MPPLFVDKNAPARFIPAKMSVPLTANAIQLVPVKPVLTAVQVLPLFVDKNTPPTCVPAKRFVPLMANDVTIEDVKPVLTAVQTPPLFVDKNTPPVLVPAKMSVPLTANVPTLTAVKPVLTAVHCAFVVNLIKAITIVNSNLFFILLSSVIIVLTPHFKKISYSYSFSVLPRF